MAKERAIPTGECWCGCGAQVPVRSFFVTGHDKRAEARVIVEEYGSVPEFVLAHGYHPGGKHDPAKGGKKRG
jgi:hypothetical protein